MDKDLKRHFTEEEMWMANKYMTLNISSPVTKAN